MALVRPRRPLILPVGATSSGPTPLPPSGHRPCRFLDPPSESGYHFLQRSLGYPPPTPVPRFGVRSASSAPTLALPTWGSRAGCFLRLPFPPPGRLPTRVRILGAQLYRPLLGDSLSTSPWCPGPERTLYFCAFKGVLRLKTLL